MWACVVFTLASCDVLCLLNLFAYVAFCKCLENDSGAIAKVPHPNPKASPSRKPNPIPNHEPTVLSLTLRLTLSLTRGRLRSPIGENNVEVNITDR